MPPEQSPPLLETGESSLPKTIWPSDGYPIPPGPPGAAAAPPRETGDERTPAEESKPIAPLPLCSDPERLHARACSWQVQDTFFHVFGFWGEESGRGSFGQCHKVPGIGRGTSAPLFLIQLCFVSEELRGGRGIALPQSSWWSSGWTETRQGLHDVLVRMKASRHRKGDRVCGGGCSSKERNLTNQRGIIPGQCRAVGVKLLGSGALGRKVEICFDLHSAPQRVGSARNTRCKHPIVQIFPRPCSCPPVPTPQHLAVSPDGLGHDLAKRRPPGRVVLVQEGNERLVRFPCSKKTKKGGGRQATGAFAVGGRHQKMGATREA